MALHDTRRETPQRSPATEPVRPPTSTGTSLRPALIVVALAVLILGFFAVFAVLTSSPSNVKTSAPPRAVPGSGLLAVPAAHALAPILLAGEPPADIVNAVSVPAGAVRTSSQNNSAAAGGQYDAQIGLRSNATQGALLTFFASEMRGQGWQVFDQGAAANDPGATEVLGKQAGSDGWYWEMGVVVSPTAFGNGAPAGGQTDFIVRLFQQSDQF